MKATKNTATWSDLCAALDRANHKFHEQGVYLDLISPREFRRIQILIFKELDNRFLSATQYGQSGSSTERADVSDIVIGAMEEIPAEKRAELVTIAEFHVFRARLMRQLQAMWDR
jgi:hypothetical protein